MSQITIGLLVIAFSTVDIVHAQITTSQKNTVLETDESISQFLDRIREETTARWENDIRELEKRDRNEADPEDGVLLLGSSSIRLWKSAAEDLAPYPVIQRGFGGARYSDLAIFSERLISSHQFRAVIIFIANDVKGADDDSTPDEVRELCRRVVQTVRRHNDQAPIFLVEVTPTEARFSLWPKTREVNAQLRELCFQESNLHFIETAESYLTFDNQPRRELFTDDQLHQNEEGYRLWGSLIRDELDRVFPPALSAFEE